jgi:hypothetical protein
MRQRLDTHEGITKEEGMPLFFWDRDLLQQSDVWPALCSLDDTFVCFAGVLIVCGTLFKTIRKIDNIKTAIIISAVLFAETASVGFCTENLEQTG